MIDKIEIHKKKVKNITLRVKRDGTVHLTVPNSVSDQYIKQFIKSKSKWIDDKLKFFKERYEKLEDTELVSGDIIKYLGESYILNVIEDINEDVKIYDQSIEIYVCDTNNIGRKQQLLNKWYLDNAKIKFIELVHKYENILNEQVNCVRIKTMKTRWGSCNVKAKNINLNLELIKKPEECIEYVVLHELAHLKHPNHSKQFWEYVSKYMPDWKERKQKLE